MRLVNAVAHHRIQGFSLIELMIALVLSLLLAGVIIALYLSNSQAAAFQMAVLRVQENGRFAVDMITRNARMAGYAYPVNVLTQEPFRGADGDPSDTLEITYQGGTSIVDCHGNSIAQGVSATNIYRVQSRVVDGQQRSYLTCTVGGTQQELAEGVENMQVLYGEDLENDGVANRYVAAASVSDWNRIVTVQVALLVNSVTVALPSGAPRTCIGCAIFASAGDFNTDFDLTVRGEFMTTASVRN